MNTHIDRPSRCLAQRLTAGLCCLVAVAGVARAEVARGIVFEDLNRNGTRDAGEPGLEGIRVSNGVRIVTTDGDGRYEVPVDDDDIVFVLKPRGLMTPVDGNNLPRFYYIHKPAGSPTGLKFPGVPPTGPLPKSIDFPLHRQNEPDKFRALFFGDTQPRDTREVEYLAHDVVEELIGFEGSFGVTLGDIVFDDLTVFEPYIEAVALVGLPWYNVLGNHDINKDVDTDELSDETYERYFGPATYSFDYGPVHYVVIDNVIFPKSLDDRTYRGGIRSDQVEFIRNDLTAIPKDRLVVFMMHVPLYSVPERGEFFDLIREYPYTLSISAHTHYLEHVFMGKDQGNTTGREHHHYVAVTACGSWWQGAPDERGIPHTTMRDGAPNGYTIITFDGRSYDMTYKAARRPAEEQMSIWAPGTVSTDEVPQTEVIVNVYAGSDKSTVEMRVEGGEWKALAHVRRPDPYFLQMKELEKSSTPPPGRKLPDVIPSPHIWIGRLPNLDVGTHRIEARTTDMFGETYESSRLIRIVADTPARENRAGTEP